MNTTQQLPIYDSDMKLNPSLQELREAFRSRYLIAQFIRRDVTTRYKRSVMGVAWTMLNPLGMMLVKVIIFSTLFGRDPLYPIYVLSGLIAFELFSDGTNSTIKGLVWGGGLMDQVYIPRSVFAISAVGGAILNSIFALVPLLLISLALGAPINLSILFVPVSIFLLSVFTLGLSLLLSISSVYFPDIAEMYRVFLRAWLYLTPIVYPERILPEAVLHWMKLINPMYYYVNIFRYPVYEGRIPPLELILPAVVVAFVTLIIGWSVFSRRSYEFVFRN